MVGWGVEPATPVSARMRSRTLTAGGDGGIGGGGGVPEVRAVRARSLACRRFVSALQARRARGTRVPHVTLCKKMRGVFDWRAGRNASHKFMP